MFSRAGTHVHVLQVLSKVYQTEISGMSALLIPALACIIQHGMSLAAAVALKPRSRNTQRRSLQAVCSNFEQCNSG